MTFIKEARKVDRAYESALQDRNLKVSSYKRDWLGDEKEMADFLVFAHNNWPEILAVVEAANQTCDEETRFWNPIPLHGGMSNLYDALVALDKEEEDV